MVRRKKKKKKEPEEEEEEDQGPQKQDQTQQWPEWTEALEIEYMNQDQIRRVIDKLREEGRDENDIKLAEDLYYARSAFKMDQFVKL